jgi:hypothetical protein
LLKLLAELEIDLAPRLTDAPYELGRTYSRRKDIHGKFGGQQQGGISTPADIPFIFLFTGDPCTSSAPIVA